MPIIIGILATIILFNLSLKEMFSWCRRFIIGIVCYLHKIIKNLLITWIIGDIYVINVKTPPAQNRMKNIDAKNCD